jgi:hypothetical protein
VTPTGLSAHPRHEPHDFGRHGLGPLVLGPDLAKAILDLILGEPQVLASCVNLLLRLPRACRHHELLEPRDDGIDRRLPLVRRQVVRSDAALSQPVDLPDLRERNLPVFDDGVLDLEGEAAILEPQIILQRRHVTTTVLVLAEQVVHTRHADEVLRSHRPMDGVDVGLLLRWVCQALRAA